MSAQNMIPLTYVVNVSNIAPQMGLTPLQVNTLLLLTDETPVQPIECDYIMAYDAATVTNAYGTNSTVGKVAQAIFSQTPNLLAGNGYLVVANYDNETQIETPATSGIFTTSNISANVDNFKAIAHGCLQVNLNGVLTPIFDVNLEEITDLSTLAAVLDAKIAGCTVTVAPDNNSIQFISQTTGVTSSVTLQPYTQTPVVTPAIPVEPAKLTTINLTNNIQNFTLEVGHTGTISLNVGGAEHNIVNIESVEAPTFEKVLSAIQTAYNADESLKEYFTIEQGIQENTIVFTTAATGSAATIEYNSAFSPGENVTDLGNANYLNLSAATSAPGQDEVPAVDGIDLYGTEYFNANAGTATIGQNAQISVTQETTSDAINRIGGQIYTEGIITCRDLTNEEAVAASNTVQANDKKILFLTATGLEAIQTGGLFTQLATNNRTRKLLYMTGANEAEKRINAKLFAGGYASKLFSVNYNGNDTTLTITYKDLSGVPVDISINGTILNMAQSVGADVYASIEGLPKVIGCQQGGLWADQLTNRTWFLNTLATTVANVLLTTNNKVPQTERGMQRLKNAATQVCQLAVTNGMAAPGEWNTSQATFGIYDEFMSNIRTFGYYIYTAPVATQLQTEREARKAPVMQIALKEAGAIEHSSILVYFQA